MAKELDMTQGASLEISDASSAESHLDSTAMSADMSGPMLCKGLIAAAARPTLALGQLKIWAEMNVRFEMK